MNVTLVLIVVGALGTILKRPVMGLEDLEIRRLLEIIQTTALLRVGQNTEKGSGDLRRLVVPQILAKTHLLTLVWKTLKGVNK